MRRGFTLIEVVLAVALMALVLALIQGVYTGTVRSRNRSSEQTRDVHQVALILDRIATEISAAYAAPAREDTTGLRVEADADGNASLVFTSLLPPIPGVRPDGGTEVGYALEPDGEGALRLVRWEDPFPGQGVDAPDPYPVMDRVLRFRVLCFDGDNWVEEWDSRERGEGPVLPRAVSVELAWGPDEEHERVLRTSAPVYRQEPGP